MIGARFQPKSEVLFSMPNLREKSYLVKKKDFVNEMVAMEAQGEEAVGSYLAEEYAQRMSRGENDYGALREATDIAFQRVQLGFEDGRQLLEQATILQLRTLVEGDAWKYYQPEEVLEKALGREVQVPQELRRRIAERAMERAEKDHTEIKTVEQLSALNITGIADIAARHLQGPFNEWIDRSDSGSIAYNYARAMRLAGVTGADNYLMQAVGKWLDSLDRSAYVDAIQVVKRAISDGVPLSEELAQGPYARRMEAEVGLPTADTTSKIHSIKRIIEDMEATRVPGVPNFIDSQVYNLVLRLPLEPRIELASFLAEQGSQRGRDLYQQSVEEFLNDTQSRDKTLNRVKAILRDATKLHISIDETAIKNVLDGFFRSSLSKKDMKQAQDVIDFMDEIGVVSEEYKDEIRRKKQEQEEIEIRRLESEKFDVEQWERRNPYQVLGITAEATQRETVFAWRTLRKQYQPESEQDSGLYQIKTRISQIINTARDKIFHEKGWKIDMD